MSPSRVGLWAVSLARTNQQQQIDIRVIIDVEVSDKVKMKESVTRSGRGGKWRSTADYVT